MVLRIVCIFVVLSLISCSGNADSSDFVEEEKKPVEAKTLYILHCESCHGLEGNKGVSGAANLQKSTLSDQEIEATIKNGNDKGMMPYKDIITGKGEISSLMEYVKTLRK